MRSMFYVPVVVGIMAAGNLIAETNSSVDVKWYVDALPAAVIGNFAADEFKVSGTRQIGVQNFADEEMMSLVSTMPSLALGAQIAGDSLVGDAQVGVAAFLNSQIRSVGLFGKLGLMMEVEKSILTGPHIGLYYFLEPEWWGDSDVAFDDAIGYLIGWQAIMGDKVSFVFSVDYLMAEIDVSNLDTDRRTPGGWTASDNKIDISGLAVQFGVRAQF